VNGEMRVEMDGRRVLVTGAGGGIGSAITRKLDEAGAAVFATDSAPAEGSTRATSRPRATWPARFAKRRPGGR
jgi:NAD(P)-dependent dehydrogenase (short-subunit alcohol dehydrogenase family)